MTENASYKIMEPFVNPQNFPVEHLKLVIKTSGVVEYIDALSDKWADDRYFLHYEAPNIYDEDGSEIIGAKEHWMQVINYMINDFKWLISLPYFRFWSNIIYNTTIMDALVSLLQEAPPFYALENFPNCPEMLQLLETIRYYVLVVFTRLITNKESSMEYMQPSFFGNLLYEKYIFTVPIIFDLCQLYGRENPKVIKRLLQCLFDLEPEYNNDFKKAVPCLIEALQNVETKFDNSIVHNGARSLTQQDAGYKHLTLFNLEDLILYVLDISSTITVFLNNYPPAVSLFHNEDFIKKIVSIYENTIPKMYKNLDKLGYNDENMPKYIELKHRLDVIRVEIINLFRIILFKPIENVVYDSNTTSEADIKKLVEEYFAFLMYAVPEREFITDYDQFHPVRQDLDILTNIYPELDMIQLSYILNLIKTPEKSNVPPIPLLNHINEPVAGPSGVQSQPPVRAHMEHVTNTNVTNTSNKSKHRYNKACMSSLVSAVKDVLNDLKEDFIKLCLEHYNYKTESVINAILEDNLPTKLKCLMSEIKEIPAEYMNVAVDEDTVPSFEALNFSDDDDNINRYDNVHIKTREDIPVSKDYILRNYSNISDDYTYEDEFDDTYDNRDVRGIENDSELDARRYTTPRVLQGKQKIETVDESDDDNDDREAEQNDKDHFIQNPAELRAKAEQRRQAMRGGRGASNVIGKPKGHGQEKDVLRNRQQKNTHKSTGANHNRRSGAQWKRNQGMVPS
ncbi:activating signal cointegrator 1 complex subunit 2 [Megalopta genalis]|uniref:activating signal cointegrator 1 complex subunit 2 n=1 Tax=Megalopta genalis TaxID=115081 RepID=UPI003FD0C0F3